MFIVEKRNKRGHIVRYIEDVLTGKLTRISHWAIREAKKNGIPMIIQLAK